MNRRITALHFTILFQESNDERYPLREETAEDRYYKNYQNRIGIDVFIFDVAPDSEFKRKMMKFRYKVIYGLGMSKRYQLKDEKYTGLQKLQVGVLRFLGKFTTTPKVCENVGEGVF